MSFLTQKGDTGRADELWPVLLLLLVVAVPTIGVLWFVGVAVDNQQLAAKQRLTEAYQSSLLSVRTQIADDWNELNKRVLRATDQEQRPRERFLAVLASVEVDSIVCLSPSGKIEYPSRRDPLPEPDFGDPRWPAAIRIENVDNDPQLAQTKYAEIANDANEQREYVLAVQAQVRCLFKMHKEAKALDLVLSSFKNRAMKTSEDPLASSAMANIELMAIESMEQGPAFERIWDRLRNRVIADPGEVLPGPQRLFLMKRMAEIAPAKIDRRRLIAEDLAAEFAARRVPQNASQILQPTRTSDVWQRSTSDGRQTVLLQTDTIRAWATDAAAKLSLPPGVHVELLPSPEPPPHNVDAIPLPIGPSMPGWQLWLSHKDDRIAATGLRKVSIHVWTGALVVLFTSVLGLVIAQAFRRRIRVANLKNDLVGTVSHELKTPLASMRLLVETLLAEENLDESTTRDYLRLIDKENVRLSRLIENFLTFSRMEQDRHTFRFDTVSLDEAIAESVDAMGERLREPDCHLTLEIEPNLPDTWGDKDALVAVFLNLLDNAHKYSNDDRQITMKATQQSNQIIVTVADNGIGMSRTDTRRIFDRFFQVDQSLVRQSRGCGLGLSIVDYVVRAHGGTVDVVSSLRMGSAFRVALPIHDASSESSERKQHGV